MPIPSRDRKPRPIDISTLYRGAARKVDLIVDQPGLIWKGLSGNGPSNVSRSGSISSGRPVGVRVAGRGRSSYAQRNRVQRAIAQRNGGVRGRIVQQPQLTGQETPGSSEASTSGVRGRDINWPSWYPRRPLRDISALVQAIERRRAEPNLATEHHQEDNLEVQQDITNPEQEEISISELEHEIGSQTPLPTIFAKTTHPSPSTQAWKITTKNPNNNEMSSNFLTPQKRLLDSIEKVREYWLEDQKRLQRTPAAKKAERKRRVRTLMSMR